MHACMYACMHACMYAKSYCTRPCVGVSVSTCVQVLCLRFDVHFISLKLSIILLSNLVWGYIRYISTYTIQWRVTD